MAKCKDDKESKLDGLEIISVGSLYSGPWDKKYWSSSRGKDRYPYPVGYQAHRAYNGSTYKMEIQEGPKGPLFLINSADGHLSSGETPDIAWEKFQKKGCPRMKIWHGKRFSCKIDGIEFFGFRNPFVQRLLRELVADLHGIAEQNLFSSSFCNGASNMDPNKQSHDARMCSDLLPYLAGPPVTKKRSKRFKTKNPSSSNIDDFKKPCAGDSTHTVEPPNSIHGNHEQRSSLPPTFSVNEKHDSCILLEAVPAGKRLKDASQEESIDCIAKDDLHLNYTDDHDLLNNEAVPSAEKHKVATSENGKSTSVVSNSFATEKPLDRLQDTEVEQLYFQASKDFKAVDAPFPKDSQSAHDADLFAPDTLDLCAPDTMDFLQDGSTNSASSTLVKINCDIKEELIAANKVVSEDLVNKLHSEEETGTSNSNVNSERSDFDSVGQDIAKSMMTVLLPQAIPLLKKSSRKKKKTVSSSEYLPSAAKFLEANNESHFFLDAQSPDVEYSVVQCAECTKSIDLDGFDGSQCGNHLMNKPLLPTSDSEADQHSFGKDVRCPNSGEQFLDVDVNGSWDFHAEICGSRDVLHDYKRQLNTTKMPEDGDLCLYESFLGCTSPKEVSTKVDQDVCENLDSDSFVAKIKFEVDLKTVPPCNEAVGASDANVTLIEAGASEKSNILSNQVLKKVYTRKKVSKAEPSTVNHNCPILEDVTCGKVLDGPNLETERALLDSELFYMSSSVDDPHKKEILNAKSRIGGQQQGLHTDETIVNSNTILDSQTPFTSPAPKFLSASEGQDTSTVVPSESHIEKPKAQFGEGLVGHENTLDVNCSQSQKQGTKFFDHMISSPKQVQGSSELKLHRCLELHKDLEGIIEFLGCYFHPMPILSLILSRKGNEIYICALCGLLADDSRTLFLYKLAIEEPRTGCPCFVGHTSVSWPSSTDVLGKEIAFERSGLQVTPDGQCLVLLGGIRTPYCREGKLNCLCPVCAVGRFENNAVKIVQVKAGYVSVVAKLEATDSFHCILVFEPDHLIAAGENRRLHLWTMNSRWSAPTEEFMIQSDHYISPLMEMKRIPKCDSLVIGHNGFEEFTLWDISKRIFLSRFSAPNTSIHQFFPISLFGWKKEILGFSCSNLEANINRFMDATKMCLSEHGENHSLPSFEKEDICIWFLVSTVCDFDSQHDYILSGCQISPVGGWRVALLVKNKLILGTQLDPRAAAIGTSAGRGIIGTHDGLVYMWELLTGKGCGTLHKFEGGSVTCIATDNSGSGVLGVVDDKGQLLVYQCLK